MSIPYNLELFECLSTIAKSVPCITINRTYETVEVRAKRLSDSVIFEVKAPGESFGFDHELEQISIYEYLTFYNLLKAEGDNASIDLEFDTIKMSSTVSKSKSSYQLMPSDMAEPYTYEPIDTGECDTHSEITADMMKAIFDRSKRISASYIEINVTSDNINLRFYSNMHRNVSEMDLDVISVTDEVEPYTILLLSREFLILPVNDYMLGFSENGFLKLSTTIGKEKDIALNIYAFDQKDVADEDIYD